MIRTANQKLADKIDLEINRIMRRVEDAMCDTQGKDRDDWARTRFSLSTARSHVRSMMSDQDRKATA